MQHEGEDYHNHAKAHQAERLDALWELSFLAQPLEGEEGDFAYQQKTEQRGQNQYYPPEAEHRGEHGRGSSVAPGYEPGAEQGGSWGGKTDEALVLAIVYIELCQANRTECRHEQRIGGVGEAAEHYRGQHSEAHYV